MEAYPLDQQDRCVACREGRTNFDAVYCFGSYEGVLRKLIHLFKYAKVESLADPLSRLLAQSLPFGESFDLVLPMPMHWRKRWERGFNQAELLAEPVAKRFGIQLSNELRRVRHTKAQAGLDEEDRQENLKGAFLVRKPAAVAGKRVLLIDDVFTTGATLRAASAALKSGGALRVTALTLARVDHPTFRTATDAEELDNLSKGLETSSSSASRRPADGQRRQSAGTGAK